MVIGVGGARHPRGARRARDRARRVGKSERLPRRHQHRRRNRGLTTERNSIADGHHGAVTERAPRRSSATVRSLVLTAARELFEQRGYEPVSTREIAERAGVTQAAVFRHFGTKAELFVEAVGEPLYAFITEYVRQWLERGHGSDT